MDQVDAAKEEATVESSWEGEISRCRTFTPMQLYFLSRLERLGATRPQLADLPEREEWLARALAKALFSTYCDCVDLDVKEEAQIMLRQENPPDARLTINALPQGASCDQEG